MKKVLLFLFAICLSIGVFAVSPVQTMTNSGDTIANAGTGSMYLRINAAHASIAFQAVVTKISGTVNAYVIFQGSNDNSNWFPIGTDTLKCANQTTNSNVWTVANNSYAYYRLYYYNGGTMAAKINGYAYGQPQSAYNNQVYTMTNTGDTVVNSGTKTVNLEVKAYHKTVSIQVVSTKISGTNGGTATLQGSVDGVNYDTVNSAFLDGTATLTVLNQTNTTKIFQITGSPYRYYRVSHTGTGTMSARLKGYLVAND